TLAADQLAFDWGNEPFAGIGGDGSKRCHRLPHCGVVAGGWKEVAAAQDLVSGRRWHLTSLPRCPRETAEYRLVAGMAKRAMPEGQRSISPYFRIASVTPMSPEAPQP